MWFESPEAAEANSEHPATQEFAAKFAALCVGEPNYCNLDVRMDEAR